MNVYLQKFVHAGFLFIYMLSFMEPAQVVFAVPGETSVVAPSINPVSASAGNESRDNSKELTRLGYTLPSFPIYQNPGGLTIEPITAYNLIVDSNVLSPASYGPSAATLGAKFCNSTGSPMTNVWAYIGNYDANQDGTVGDPDPGVYPQHNPMTHLQFEPITFAARFPQLANYAQTTGVDYGDPIRFYALEHEAGSGLDRTDASRYLGTLAPGECRTEYWLVSYPRVATINGSRVDVTGDVKPDDDLWLWYFFWANADSVSTSYYWRPVTMRNEISAMANKIWPNGDNKVPDAYVAAIQQMLGWDTWTPNGSGTTAYPGETVVSQGIWYDLGNVGHGFDNDGDLVPDRNLWVQPIGDAASYDPGCFRLVRAYGLVIVKLNDGSELLIPFVDQMYFENIPDNNNGAVGLVFYEYIALDGACTAGLTPYQEVASGYDNEKFNADFGAGIPALQSRETNMILDKRGFVNGVENAGVTAGGSAVAGTINYTVTFSLPDVDATAGNTMTITVGNPTYGMPLTVYETIPAGTQYVGGSASSVITMTNYAKGTVPATVLFSTDSGVTWSTTDPGNVTSTSPNNLVIIKWHAQEGIISPASGAAVTGTVSFSSYVPGSYTSAPVVDNTSCIKLGDADCFEEDTHTTLVLGSATIQGSVFADTNTLGNAIYETGTESGIQNVTVSLYYDANGDGDDTDAGDFLVRTIDSSGAAGDYSFTQLPATSGFARYIVIVDVVDPQITSTGYGLTTPSEYTGIALSAGQIYGDSVNEPSDFGFAPALNIDKRLDTTSTVLVGDSIQYTIAVSNIMPGNGSAGNACVYNLWATSEGSQSSSGANNVRFYNPGQSIPNPTNAFNSIGPDGLYSFGNFEASGSQLLAGTGFGVGNLGGNITNVRMRVKYYLSAPLSNDQGTMYFYTAGAPYGTTVFSNATLNSHVGLANAGWMEVSLGATNPATGTAWKWNDFAASQVVYRNDKINAGDQVLIYIDALGLELTTDGTCGGSGKVLNPVPLTDTFDDAYFDFVSADPPVSSSSTGLLTWNNLGPLYPGQTRFVTVTMRAAQAGGSTATDNTATSTGAAFSNGLPANSPESDIATVTIGANANTRTFTGTIFDDNTPANGWSGTAWSSGGTGMEAGDTGMRGVKVNLYACYDASTGALVTGTSNSPCATAASGNDGEWRLLRTTYTAPDGTYSFGNLAQGFYYAQVDTGYIIGSQVADVNQAGPCTTCDSLSNLPASDNLNASFVGNLSTNTSVTRVNFGYNITGSYNIGDLLFYDWNGNGIQDAEDEGLSGVTVRLLDPSGAQITTTPTGTNGSYLFSNYPNGIYTVQVDTSTLPSGLVQTLDPETNNDGFSRFALNGGDDLARDFAYQPNGSGTIGDTVWRDMNGDGAQSGAQETGISGVTVKLQVDLNGDGAYVTIATDTTDANGKYLFENLPLGAAYNYLVMLDLDAANLSRIPDDAYGNDYYNTTGTLDTAPTPDMIYRSASITGGSRHDLSADFGFAPPASLGDTVFWDTNANGTQDTGEAGIPNARVDLYTFTDANGNSRYDPGEPVTYSRTDYTDAGGKYLFSGLIPGYYVAIVDTTTVSYDPGTGTLPNPILNPTLTSDPSADGVAQSCAIDTNNAFCDARDGMRLYANTNYTGADFGFRPSGAFGDTIWLDQDGDGAQDPGEPGLADVTVSVDNGAGTVLTTTTNSDGNYFFQNLNPNTTWSVSVTAGLPVGLSSTYDPDTGTTGSNGSTTVVIDASGNVTEIGAGACATCSLSVDFGYRYAGSYDISGTVCLDSSTDGACGAGEANYFQNVLVSLVLWEDDGDRSVETGETTVIATRYTDANGDYLFSDYPNGDYFVTVSALPDFLTLTTDPGETPQNNISSTTSGGYVLTARQQITLSSASVAQVDFAFAETLPPMDYGDLPDTYKTLYASQGARHAVPTTPSLYLGSTGDTETDGVPGIDANGDDSAGSDDEDGVTFNTPSNWVNGANPDAITVNVAGNGYLYGWMDTNNDGDFADAGEKVITSSGLVTGSNTYSLNLPAIFGNNADVILYSRFRIFPTQPLIPGLAYFGAATDGEVEDYALSWKLTVDKDTNTPTVAPGGQAEYVIVVRNTGNQTITGVQISDNLDVIRNAGDFTFASMNAPVENNATRTVVSDPSTGATSLIWGTWDINPGGSVTVVFRLNVSASIPADPAISYDNTVTVASNQLGTVDDDGTLANDSNTPGSPASDPEEDEDIRVDVVPGGDLSVTKDDGQTTYWPGQSLTYTIRVYNAGPANATDATFSDTKPEMIDSWIWSCAATGAASCGATTSGTGNISANDVDIAAGAGNSLTYTITALVSAAAAGDLTNTATIAAPTGFIDPTPGNNTASDTDARVAITPVKSIQATSESVTSGSDTLIGEIVRYRLAFELPEGTSTNLQVLDDLVNGLRFMNDEAGVPVTVTTAKVALVCTVAANCTSSTLTGISVDGNAVTTPTVSFPDAAVSNNATTDADTYPSSGPVYFKLGNVTNNDKDADSEYVVIEFNALVDNTASNNANGTHGNQFTVLVDGAPVATSNNVSITVREPAIATPFIKTVTTTPADGGDSITYTLQFTNSGSAPAFDILITDTLNAVLEGTVTVGGSATCGGSPVTPVLSSFTAQVVSATVACLDPGATATVTISAKVIDTAAAGQSFSNTASLTYTSLPGLNGTTSNPTGSSTPGVPGDFTGERTGSGTSSNDFAASSGTVTTTLAAPAIDKLDPNPLNYVIGADVTYNICVTLPEGTIQGLVLTDNLPAGLAYQSHTLTSAADGICPAASAAYAGDAQTVTTTRTSPAAMPGASGENLVLTFPTITTTANNDSGDNTFLVAVTARVLNILANQDGTPLSNSGSLTFTDPNDASIRMVNDPTAPADIQVIEPLLTLDKTAAPASVSSGAAVTFTLVIAHDAANSHATAYDVTVTDPLPSGFTNLTNINVTNPGSCAFGVVISASTSSALTASIGTLPQGCAVTLEFDATADGSQTGSIQNTANITWTSLSGALSGRERDGSDGASNLNDYVASDPVSVTVTAPTVYDLSLAKTLATGQSATVAPGDDVIFTITVTNNGNVTSGQPITITDTIPVGMTLNDPDWTAGAGNTATYNLATPIAAGASTSVDITLAVSGSFGGGTLANYAEITTDQGSDQDSTPGNGPQLPDEDDDSSANVTVNGYSISGSVFDDRTGSANDVFDTGDDPIQGVTVGLFLDAGSGVPGTQVGSNVTTLADGSYGFTNVLPGNYVVVETDLSGYFSVTDINGDTTAPLYNRIPVIITNTDSTGNDFLDELLTYTISGSVFDDSTGASAATFDAGDEPIQNVTTGLYLDAGDGVPGTQVGSDVTTLADGSYGFTNLPPGNYVVVETDPSGYISVSDIEGDITAPAYNRIPVAISNANVTGRDFLDVKAAPQISVDKSLRTVTFDSPQLLRLTYDIEVRNTGNTVLSNIQLTDDLALAFVQAVSFSVVSVLPGPFTLNPNYDGNTDGGANPAHVNLLAGTDTLTPGGSGTITLVLLVDTGGKVQTYRNTAVVAGEPPSGNRVSDEDFADGPAFADPAVTKAVSPDQAAVGDQVTFTITVFNNGTQPAAGVIVTDTFPANLDLIPGSVAVTPPVNATNPPDYITVTAPRTVVVRLDTLDVNEVFTITVQAVVNSLGQPPIQNEVALSTSSPAPWTGNLSANDRSLASLNLVSDPVIKALPDTGFAPDKETLLPIQPVDLSYTNLGEIWLEIPSLKVKTTIVGVPRSAGAWNVAWLGEQAGWLQGTAFPTWQGNSVLTGHVYLPNGKPGPFVDVNRLRFGNQVIVHAFGQRYIYEIRTNHIILPGDMSPFRHEVNAWLTLLTCKGYDESSNTYKYRIEARAVLVKVEAEK